MNRSLLIVEDDRDQLDAATRWFIEAGCQVLGVAHPRQALQAASFRQFQVALLDASLPEMDGLELMQRLKRIQDAVQVVILSGYQYPEQRAKADGAFACLVKPCRMALLEATVENAFERVVDESLVRDQRANTDEMSAAAGVTL